MASIIKLNGQYSFEFASACGIRVPSIEWAIDAYCDSLIQVDITSGTYLSGVFLRIVKEKYVASVGLVVSLFCVPHSLTEKETEIVNAKSNAVNWYNKMSTSWR
jgi:hypothetical protein